MLEIRAAIYGIMQIESFDEKYTLASRDGGGSTAATDAVAAAVTCRVRSYSALAAFVPLLLDKYLLKYYRKAEEGLRFSRASSLLPFPFIYYFSRYQFFFSNLT